MIVYTGALIWVLLLCMYNSQGRMDLSEKQYPTRTQAFLAMFYLVFFLGLRSAGADTSAYIVGYRMLPEGFDIAIKTALDFSQEENLFEAYGVAMKTLFGNNYTPYLFGIAAFSGFAIAKCLYRYSEGFFTSMILFIMWGTWSWMFNGIRQFTAVSIVFLALSFMERRRPVLYMLAVFIAFRVHTAALMMLPMYFVVRSEPWSGRTLIILAVTALAVMFSSQFLGALGSVSESMDLSYGETITSSYFTSDDGSNIIRTLIFAVPTGLAFIHRETIRRDAPDVIKICVNMSILCVCVSAVANVTSGIYIGRLPIFFSMYNLLLLPWLFCNTDLKYQKSWIWAVMLFYTALFVYENYIYGHPYYMSEMLNLRIV